MKWLQGPHSLFSLTTVSSGTEDSNRLLNSILATPSLSPSRMALIFFTPGPEEGFDRDVERERVCSKPSKPPFHQASTLVMAGNS